MKDNLNISQFINHKITSWVILYGIRKGVGVIDWWCDGFISHGTTPALLELITQNLLIIYEHLKKTIGHAFNLSASSHFMIFFF